MRRPSLGSFQAIARDLPGMLEGAPRLRAVGNAVLAVGFAVGAVWLASLWNPFYVDSTRLEPLHTIESQTLLDHRPDVVGGELLEGTSVRQLILLQDPEVEKVGAVERFICVRPALMFDILEDGESVGEVRLRVESGDRRTTRWISKATGVEPVCLAVPDADPYPETILVRLDGGPTERPASWFVAETREGGPLALPAQVFAAGSDSAIAASVAAGPLALTVTSHWTRTEEVKARPLADRSIDMLILASPAAVAVVTIIMLFTDPAARRRSRGKWMLRGSLGSLLAGALVLTIAVDAIVDRGGTAVLVSSGTWLGAQPSPAGELVDGASVSQAVEPRLLPRGRLSGQDRLCAEVLLATYGDRKNEGSVSYVLSDGLTDLIATIDAETIADNSWTPGCFDARSIELLDGRALTLSVRGSDARDGRAVTAWLRPASGGEPAAETLGTAGGPDRDDLVLRYRFSLEPSPLHGRAVELIGQASVAGGLVGLLAGGLLLLRERKRGPREDPREAPVG